MSLVDPHDDELFPDDPAAVRLTDALRLALREEYADADDEELEDALGDLSAAMSPAEAFNFAGALNRIGKGTGRLLGNPAVASVVHRVAPALAGGLGTVIAGPGVGTALGTRLGTVVAGALPGRPVPPAAAPRAMAAFPPAPTVVASGTGSASPAASPAAAGMPPPVIGGSPAAAKAVVLANQGELMQALLSTAFGQHGRATVGGIPVARLLGAFSQIVGEAAADADELYHLRHGDDGEDLGEDLPDESPEVIYTSLVDADHLELAEAFDDEDGWEYLRWPSWTM